MGKRFISILLLAAVLLLPVWACAETDEQRDIAVVLLADYKESGNIEQDVLIDSLKSFVAMAEMQGRNVVIYGPCTAKNRNFILYQKPDDALSSEDDWQTDIPQNYRRMINYTLEFLQDSASESETDSFFKDKHAIFLVGAQLSDAEFDEKFVEGLFPAAQLDVINIATSSDLFEELEGVLKAAQPDTVPSEPATPSSADTLTDTLLKLLWDKDVEGTSNLMTFTAYSAATSVPTADEAVQTSSDETGTEQDTSSDTEVTEAPDSFTVDEDAPAETPATVDIPVLPQLRKSAFLYIRTTGDWQDLQITSPDGTTYTLSATDSDDPLFIHGVAVPDGALFMMKDFAENSNPTSDFEDWVLSINSDVQNITIYYNRIVFSNEYPIILLNDTAIEANSNGSYVFSNKVFKNDRVILTLNEEHPDIQQQIRLEGSDSLRLACDGNQYVTITEDERSAFFQAGEDGEYEFVIHLISHDIPVAEQTYSAAVTNCKPEIAEGSDIPEELQNLYWEENKVISFCLSDLFIDPDNDPLTWSVITQPVSGMNVRIDNDQAILEHTADKNPQKPDIYTFTIRATDVDGDYCDHTLMLKWKSLVYEVTHLKAVFTQNPFAKGLGKNDPQPIEFYFTYDDKELDNESLNAEKLLSFLQNDAQIYIIEKDDKIAPIKANWTDENTLSATITVDHHGDFTFGWRIISCNDDVVLDDTVFTACHDDVVTVSNSAPTINKELTQSDSSHQEFYWSPSDAWIVYPYTAEVVSKNSSVEANRITSADTNTIPAKCTPAFIDTDRDMMTYKVIIAYKVDDVNWHEFSVQNFYEEPYSVSTDDWQINDKPLFQEWRISITATDVAGAESETFSFTLKFINGPLLTLRCVAVFIVLMLLIWLIAWLCKPSFTKNATLQVTFDNEIVTLKIGRWKKKMMPLNRVIPSLQTTSLSRTTCAALAKVYVKPTRTGLTFIDKNRPKVLANPEKVEPDVQVNLQIDTHELHILLNNNQSAQ